MGETGNEVPERPAALYMRREAVRASLPLLATLSNSASFFLILAAATDVEAISVASPPLHRACPRRGKAGRQQEEAEGGKGDRGDRGDSIALPASLPSPSLFGS